MFEMLNLVDTEAERLVVGALLIDDDYLPAVRDILKPDDLFDSYLRFVYRAMLAVWQDGARVDVYTLKWKMKELGYSWKPSEIARCASLPTGGFAEHYAKRVSEMAIRRRMWIKAERLAARAMRPLEKKNGSQNRSTSGVSGGIPRGSSTSKPDERDRHKARARG